MTTPASHHPKSKTAALNWILARAEALVDDLQKSRTSAASTDTRAGLRLSLANLLHCADFVLDVAEVSHSMTPHRPAIALPEYLALDVGHLRSKHYLASPHEEGVLSLWRQGIMLPFAVSQLDGGNYEVVIGPPGEEQAMRITTTEPSFGGVRYWFVCPSCKGRFLRLYRQVTEDGFACRACHKASHDAGWRSAKDRKVLTPIIQHDSPEP